MTATEELRRLLDERGVEWHGSEAVYWMGANAVESIYEDDTLDVMLYSVSPKQAIAATLGPGTCKGEEYEDTGILVCSECGAVQPDDHMVYYCWCCGAKVV